MTTQAPPVFATKREFNLDRLAQEGLQPEYCTQTGQFYFHQLKLVFQHDSQFDGSPACLQGTSAIALDYTLTWTPEANLNAIPQAEQRIEGGACAVALLVVGYETEFDVAGSSARGKRNRPIGADFVLTLKSRSSGERTAQVAAGRDPATTPRCDGLLEVSGTAQRDRSASDKRKKAKLIQIQRNNHNLRTTCFVVVVDFWHSNVLTEILRPSCYVRPAP